VVYRYYVKRGFTNSLSINLIVNGILDKKRLYLHVNVAVFNCQTNT